MDLENILTIVVYSVPIYSSITGALLMMLTYQDCINYSEKRLKFLLIFYYIFASVIWFGTIAFHYSHSFFIYLNPIFYSSLLLASVTLYHFIFYLTATQKNDRFSMWHYFLPIMIFLVIFIWSLFIPYDTQYAIVAGKNTVVNEFKYYSIFYISKNTLRILNLIIYVSLSAHRLYSYSKVVIDHHGSEYKKYIFWLWYILGLSLILIFISIATALSTYTHIHKFLSNIFIVLFIAIGHAMMGYNIIRRNYYLLFTEKIVSFNHELEENSQIYDGDRGLSSVKNLLTPRRRYTQYRKKIQGKINSTGSNLTKKQFEQYFKEYKPYLNPDFRITDLILPFEINRTYISRFINKEYGMNFNRYVNRCRLQKLEMLIRLEPNGGRGIQELLKLAGFGSYRSYMRAKLIEEEDVNNKKSYKK